MHPSPPVRPGSAGPAGWDLRREQRAATRAVPCWQQPALDEHGTEVAGRHAGSGRTIQSSRCPVPVVPSCLLEPAWAGSAPCSMSAAMVSSRSFSQGIRWAATAAGCRTGWCLSTWWPRWCTAAGMSGSPARGARPHHPSAAGRMGGAGPGRGALRRTGRAVAGGPAEGRVLTAGTSIWTPGHDQRQCSFSTALLWLRSRSARNHGPGRGPHRSEHERLAAITGGNQTPLAAAQPSAAERFVWIRSRPAEDLRRPCAPGRAGEGRCRVAAKPLGG